MGLTKNTAVAVLPTTLSPLGKACARMDLTAVHDILLKTGYKDEEGAENEVCQITTFFACNTGLISYYKVDNIMSRMFGYAN